MKSKKLIGFIAVLAVIAVVFAGSAAAVASSDSRMMELTNTSNVFEDEAALMIMPTQMLDSSYVMLHNLDSNQIDVSNLIDSGLLKQDVKFLANLNGTALGNNRFIVGLNNLDTNADGNIYLADLSRYADVNSAALNGSVAVSVADLTKLALNTGNMKELSTFLAKLDEADTTTAKTTLRADLDAMKTDVNTTADVNADTNKSSLSAATGTTLIRDRDSSAADALTAEKLGLKGKVAGVVMTDDVIKGVLTRIESADGTKTITVSAATGTTFTPEFVSSTADALTAGSNNDKVMEEIGFDILIPTEAKEAMTDDFTFIDAKKTAKKLTKTTDADFAVY